MKKLKFINKIIIVIILINILNPYRVMAADNIIKRGDCNGDGTIDITDVLKILRHDASNKTSGKENWKLTEEEIKRADVNKDGKADISDVLHILRYISAKSDEETRKKHPDWITKLEDTDPKEDENKEILPQAIALDKTGLTLDMSKNPQGKLIATITPNNTNSKNKITWKSSNEGIAKVDQNGTVTGIKNGEVTITATTENGKTAVCKVIVKNSIIEATSIALNATSATIDKIGKTINLKATIKPTNATKQEVTWKSSNTSVATVDQNGKVTAKKDGTAKITAALVANKNISATCTITVKEYTQTAANLLKSLNKFSKRVQSDYKKGKYWRYHWVSKDKTFEQAISSGRRQGTCVSIVQWGLKDIGALKKDMYYGYTSGTVLKSKNGGDKYIRQYATIIKISSRRTPKQLQGTKYELKPGDIIAWNINHMSIYAGNHKFYDAGKCGLNGCSAEYGAFKTFGPVANGWTSKVKYIIRLKR